MRHSVGLVAVTVFLAGCTAPSVVAGPSAAPATVACEQVIGAMATPSGDYTIVAGDVALLTGRTLQVSDSGQPGPTRYWAKQGLGVRAGSNVELRITPLWTDRARIGWGSSALPGIVVRVSNCPQSVPGPWNFYAGGFHVDQPACLPVEVSSGGTTQLVLIGVGKACPS